MLCLKRKKIELKVISIYFNSLNANKFGVCNFRPKYRNYIFYFKYFRSDPIICKSFALLKLLASGVAPLPNIFSLYVHAYVHYIKNIRKNNLKGVRNKLL